MHQHQWERAPDGTIRRVSSERSDPATQSLEVAPAGEATTDYRPRVRRALRLGLRDLYDYLGSFVFVSGGFSLLWVSLPLGASRIAGELVGGRAGPGVVLLFGLCLVLASALLMGPLTAGLFRFARNVAARRDPDLLDLLWGFRDAFGKSARLAAIQGVVTAALVADLMFFAQSPPAASPLSGLTWVAGFFAYGLAAWSVLCLYQWVLLAEQETRARTAVKKSFLLLLDNPWFSVRLAVGMALIGALLVFSGLGALLFGVGFVAVVSTQGVRDLLRKYGLAPPDPSEAQTAPDDAWGHGWHE